MPGKEGAMDAALLNSGMSMDIVCVDSIVAPLMRRTVKGLSDLILFLQGALIKRKWPVHPESTMAVSCCLRSNWVRQSQNSLLLFKAAAPSHHSLLFAAETGVCVCVLATL
jgi:hypothetical protein